MQSFKGRERARRFAMQALYGWHIAKHDIKDVEKFYRADRNPKNYDEDYFIHLIRSIADQTTELDTELAIHSDRAINELDPIELAILRIATFEFKHSFDIPFRVVIHEAISLAQQFGAHDSYKFVNTVLDKMARQLRPAEVEQLREACG